MTRRERAAMALALACLRESVPVLVTGRLRSSPGFREGQAHRVDDVEPVLRIGGHGLVGPWIGLSKALADHSLARRLIRARLALYLRARLRADDPPELTCDACGDTGWCRREGDRCDRCWDAGEPPYDGHYRRRRFAPLWQQAPAHGGGA